MYSMLRTKAGGLREDVVGAVQELVSVPSPSFEEGGAAQSVLRIMQALDYDRAFIDDAGNVVGVMRGAQAGPAALLVGHMDTVEPQDERSWPGGPYGGQVADGKVHGLGTADCKGGIAAQLYAGALLKRSLLPLRGDLVVAATVAEANGRSIGVRALMEHTLPDLGVWPRCAILGEPTDNGLYYGHDGWMEVEVRVRGANRFLVDDMAASVFDDFDKEACGEAGEATQSLAVTRPRHADLSGLRQATIGVAHRLRREDSPHTVLAGLRRRAAMAIGSTPGLAIDLDIRRETRRLYNGQTTELRQVTSAWMTDPFGPEMERARQALAAAGMERRPARWELGRLGMGTAGSVLVDEFDTPTIGFGPGHEEQAHAPGEHVSIERLVDAVYGTAALVHSLVGVPVFGWSADEI